MKTDAIILLINYLLHCITVFGRTYNVTLVYNTDHRNPKTFMILTEMVLFHHLEYFLLVFERWAFQIIIKWVPFILNLFIVFIKNDYEIFQMLLTDLLIWSFTP